MNDEQIILKLKSEVDKLGNSKSPKIIFIGGLPGAGKSLLIEKTKKDFSKNDFSVIEPDLYRKYYPGAKSVEETVEKTNKIELEMLMYSLENKKNIIHISSLRSFEYIDNIINEYIISKKYEIYLYILVTDEIECILSTYERYILDKKDLNKFARLNKCDYLKVAINSFEKAVVFFLNKNYFKKIKIFKRGKTMALPVQIHVSNNKNIKTALREELNKQRKKYSLEVINKRFRLIEKELDLGNEKKEFEKTKKYIVELYNKEEDKEMDQIINKQSKNFAKECFEEAINLGLDFKLENNVTEKHITKDVIDSLMQIPSDGVGPKKIIKEFKNYILPYCTNFSNEKFVGFPDAGNSISGISGAIISDFMQQNLINSSFCAPIATFMEIAVIKWLRELVGYKIEKINNISDVGGIITYGGTGSNATAMLLARENYHKNTMITGVKDPQKYKIIIPKGIGHYSIRSASMWMGCGDNIIEVETKDFKYDLKKLEQALKKHKGDVMCVVAYVGDSRTMTIDNLKEIHKLVKSIDKNTWLHADACHGFSLSFSNKLRKLIDGIDLFDSISTDPHKVLAIPYCISALLVKKPHDMNLILSTSDLIMQEDFAYGQITPFIGSKSWVSLKLWFSMKSFGIKGYGKLIERRYKMAKCLKNKLEKSEDFVVLNDVNINSVVFMYVGDKNHIKNVSIDELNNLNLSIYNELMREGKYYLHKFTIPDNKGIVKKDAIVIPLRYMSGNDNITEKDLDNMLNHIRKMVKKGVK